MPVRQLSNASSAAKASNNSETTTSTTRMVVTGGESPAGAPGSSTTISSSDFCIVLAGRGIPGARSRATMRAGGVLFRGSPRLFRDEACFGHQVLVELVVLFQETQQEPDDRSRL